jgi:hypothetical protein
MSWIKRNLFFVLGLAAGLGLAGYCGWLFYENSDQVSKVKTELESNVGQLTSVQNSKIYPDDNNIKIANDDQGNCIELLEAAKKVLASMPVPPNVDEQGFRSYLGQTVVELGEEATNAGVKLPEKFGFAFTEQLKGLTFPPENIRPWMEQLGEIKAVCGVLFDAKVSSVVSLQRVRVSASDDGQPSDYFSATVVTNAPEVFTPYKVCFRGLSRELADVLDGLARSSNFIRVKVIDVQHDEAGNTSVPVALDGPAGGGGDVIVDITGGDGFWGRPDAGLFQPRPMFVQNRGGGGRGGGGRGGGGRGGGGRGGGGAPGGPGQGATTNNPSDTGNVSGGSGGSGGAGGSGASTRTPAGPGAGGPAGRGGRFGAPVNVLTEGLLRVSLSVEVVKLSGGGR